MKKKPFLLSIIFILGCNTGSETAVGESLEVSQTHGECIVKDEWLNKEYDHSVDYRNAGVKTDFFLLAYSHAPSYCESMERIGRIDDVPFECKSPNKFGWVIHGLWGESKSAYINGENDKHPRFCQGDLAPLGLDKIKPYLCMSPSTRLLQGEWEKHGACDFNSVDEYFSKTKQLFEKFLVPPVELKAKAAMQWMKDTNPALGDKRLYLYGDEFGICYSTDFEVMSCPGIRN